MTANDRYQPYHRAERMDTTTMTSANFSEDNVREGVERPEGGFQPASYTSHFVEVDGSPLHYLDYGRAGRAPIVCVHGGAAHGHWFDFFASGFNADFHVRALDFRGHGDSPWMNPPNYTYEAHAADLAGVAEQLDLRDFILVGHSMGGLVSLVYTATYPGRIRALIIVDSTLRMPEERVAMLRNVGNRPGSRYATHEEFLSRYRLRPDGTTAAPEIIRHLAERGGRTSSTAMSMRSAIALMGFHTAGRLPSRRSSSRAAAVYVLRLSSWLKPRPSVLPSNWPRFRTPTTMSFWTTLSASSGL
jgi:pimeloyl-ACP methyl ester carboxylesterase